ncbi:MAG: molecular chaperone TorD family protein [Gemmatimonadota bacterium]|nr:molecular chaperone TorD family protein [Gemmatimonadota bacterium]
MELYRALGTLIEAPSPEHARVAAALGLPAVPTPAEHGRVVVQQRYPYASVYLGAEGMLGGEARDRIAGFRRALGLEGDTGADPERGGHATGTSTSARAPDHLASLLGLLAAVEQWQREETDPARQALLTQARMTLIWEHLASWIGPYLATFEDCGAAFYQAWASLFREALDRLYDAVELPDYLPAALRAATSLADPRREGGPAFIASLLAPVRSGLILLRDDLERLGDDVGLACRAGERRYVLNAFLAQDPGRTLGWLAGHAEGWSRRMEVSGPVPIAAWWSERAENAAIVLEELAGEIQPGSAARPAVAEADELESPGDLPTRATTLP